MRFSHSCHPVDLGRFHLLQIRWISHQNGSNTKPSSSNIGIEISNMFKAASVDPNHHLADSSFPLRHLCPFKPSLPLHTQQHSPTPPIPLRFCHRKRHRLGLRLLRPHRPVWLRVRTVLRLLTPPSILHLLLLSHPFRHPPPFPSP